MTSELAIISNDSLFSATFWGLSFHPNLSKFNLTTIGRRIIILTIAIKIAALHFTMKHESRQLPITAVVCRDKR